MDNLTHTLTGVVMSRAGLNRWHPRSTVLLMLAANVPDIDVLAAFGGSLNYFVNHRGITHSIAMAPAMALLPMLLVCALARSMRGWKAAYALSLIGVASHLLLDWTNIYGVRLLLPFSSQWLRSDLNNIVERTIHRGETSLQQVVDRDAIMQLKAACRDVLVAEHVQEFAIDLVMSTQPGTPYAHDLANKYVRYGSSPRGAQALVECGRVLALMRGRLNISIDDIREIAPAVLRHRIILNFDAHADGQTPETILGKVIEDVTSAAVK